MSQDDSSETSIPFHLMPLAAILGTYILLCSISILNIIYRNLTHKPTRLTDVPPTPIKSLRFVFLILRIIVCALGYAYIVSRVQTLQTLMSPFNPYEILSLPEGTTDTSVIKSSYRALSKIHHPDKGGDESKFQEINTAYKTLTDDVSRSNWEAHGHPDGPQSFTLTTALPPWLLHPEGSVAVVLVVMYLSLFVGIIVYVVRHTTKVRKKESEVDTSNSVCKDDVKFIMEKLSSDMSHFDALTILATTPESLLISQKKLDKIAVLKKQKLALLEEERKNNMMDLSGDWGDDEGAEDDDEVTKAKIAAAKQEEREKLLQKAALNNATGTVDMKMIKLEGVDDKVLGQLWVQKVLEERGMWPPKSKVLEEMKGDVLDDAATRRNLTMLVGRVNANVLNTHPELTAASQNQLIDSIYFRNTVEFRQRTGLLLEAALRIASTTKSYPIAKTLVETVTMFKIGCPNVTDTDWFHTMLENQYSIVPQLVIDEKTIETEGEDEIATGDNAFLKISMERLHAEAFTKAKILQAQKQGIPPQVALSTYREGWWLLLRAEKIANLDGSKYTPSEKDKSPKMDIPKGMELTPQMVETMEKTAHYHTGKEKDILLACWPSIVSNVAQKMGKTSVPFKVPDEPGKYMFYVDVMSQEFLGCDQSFEMEVDVLDLADVKRKQKELEESEGEIEDAEAKKDN